MSPCLRCLAALFALVFLASCSDAPHEGDFPMPDGQGALVVGLRGEAAVDSLMLYLFDGAGRCVRAREYADPRTLASECHALEAGPYTVAVVANAGGLPTDTTLAALAEWLQANAACHPHLLTASAPATIAAGEVTRLVLRLESGLGGMDVGTLRLHLTLPDPHLPPYGAKATTRAASAGWVLRCVAELCRAGTDEVVMRKTLNPAPETDSTFTLELTALCGNYALRLWTDHARADRPTADTYYNTEHLESVSIVTDPYTAHTDAKDAACCALTDIALPREGRELVAKLQRPLAKFRIIATDGAEYRKLSERHPQQYPPIGELTVGVDYEGYFPSRFNVATGQLTDAALGIGYAARLSDAATAGDTVQLCSDWVLVNGKESFVVATVTVSDSGGNVLSRTSGVRIDYRRGCLTTVRGNFLTASRGPAGGGAIIDTEWSGDYVIGF